MEKARRWASLKADLAENMTKDSKPKREMDRVYGRDMYCGESGGDGGEEAERAGRISRGVRVHACTAGCRARPLGRLGPLPCSVAMRCSRHPVRTYQMFVLLSLTKDNYIWYSPVHTHLRLAAASGPPLVVTTSSYLKETRKIERHRKHGAVLIQTRRQPSCWHSVPRFYLREDD